MSTREDVKHTTPTLLPVSVWPIGFGSALKPPWLECVTRTCWTASGVECVTPPEDDRDTLQRFTQPFNQTDKKVATRHLETSNDSPTRENDLSPRWVSASTRCSSNPCPVSLRSHVRGGCQFHHLSFLWVNPALQVKSVRRRGATRLHSQTSLPMRTSAVHALASPRNTLPWTPSLYPDRLVPCRENRLRCKSRSACQSK